MKQKLHWIHFRAEIVAFKNFPIIEVEEPLLPSDYAHGCDNVGFPDECALRLYVCASAPLVWKINVIKNFELAPAAGDET